MKKTQKLATKTAFTLAESIQKKHVIAPNEKEIMSLRSGIDECRQQSNTCAISPRGVAPFDGRRSRKPRRGTSVARDKQQSTEMLNFRCCCERCRLMRGAEGSVRPGNDMKARKCAFTLAETLIALAVIGIVAALTIPGIVHNFQKHSWEVGQKKFIKTFTDLTALMNINNELSGYSSTEDFIKKFATYAKVTDTCENSALDGCFSKKILLEDGNTIKTPADFKTAKNLGESFESNTVGVRLGDGQSVLIAYNPGCPVPAPVDVATGISMCLSVMYDVNGDRKPNQVGKDILKLSNEDIADYLKNLQNYSLPESSPSTEGTGGNPGDGGAGGTTGGDDQLSGDGSGGTGGSGGSDTGNTDTTGEDTFLPGDGTGIVSGGTGGGGDEAGGNTDDSGNDSGGGLQSNCAFEFNYTDDNGNTQHMCFTKVLAPGEYEPLPMVIDGVTKYCSDFKDELGIATCYYGETDGDTSYSDYWAGAVYACGGVSKMASQAQLILLAKYLYGTDSIKDYGYNDTSSYSSTFNSNVANTPFGDYYSSNSCFNIWAGAEYDSDYACNGSFYPSDTGYYHYGYRKSRSVFAVCVE